MKYSLTLLVTVFTFGIILSACHRESSSTPELSPLAQRGKQVYQSACTSCHNANPKLAGSLGPDVYGSSRDLIHARILGEPDPKGYTPKRKTKMMGPQTQFKDEIDALQAYLNSTALP